MGRKQPPKPDFFASSDVGDARFGKVFPGQLKDERFKALPLGARYLYLLCRAQEQSDEGRRCLYKHSDDFGREYPPGSFVFPASHLKKYGVDSGNASRYFQALTQAGFLRVVEQNQHQRIVNVYAFSAEWKKTALSQGQKTSVSGTEAEPKNTDTSVPETEDG